MILFYDTETTGLLDFKKPAEDPSQPRIVQLGAILYDANRRVVSEMNLLVKPEGWTIPKEASDIHGITQEMAEQYGLPNGYAVDLFMDLADRAELLVAHNYSFDEQMVRAELHRLNVPESAAAFQKRKWYCTMKGSTPILKLPGKYDSFKWPNLQEAHTHFTGKPFDGAHDAMSDVRACAAVYYAMHPLPLAATEIPQ